MTIAIRVAETTWEGPLDSGAGVLRTGSGAVGEQVMTWASRTERANGMTSPEELVAAAHSACYAMALAMRLGEHQAVAQQLAVDATVTLDHAEGVPVINVIRLDVTARVPGLDPAGFDAIISEASDLCPMSRLLAGAQVTIRARLLPASLPGRAAAGGRQG